MSKGANYLHPSSEQRLELFVKPGCPYCAQAFAHYDALGVPYLTHDAQNDRAARARMFAYTGKDPTVPAIVLDGAYVRSGWGDPPRG
ncbi:MAG: glutaredoxin domain-containing protein [Vulcanimicrobiaceae bacterium]